MRLTKIGEFLKRSKIPIDIEDDIEYNRVTIRINHNGVSLRDSEIGKKIGTKKQFILKSGQFIVSKIDARYGAFGIAPDEVEGAIITGNFWAYDVDKKKVNIEWFNQFTNSADFYDICERASSGITHRKYLDEKFFLNYEILLPNVDEQLIQIEKIKSQKNSFSELSTELTHQLTLVKKLRQQILQDAVQGKLVEQNKNDEPASELLKKIKAALRQAQGDKKGKKEKELPPIKPEEIPFEIPENWVWCRLGEIIYDTEGGKSPNCLHEPAKDNEWGVIKTTAVQEMYFLENENKVLPSNFIVSEQHKVIEGDILITRAGPKNRVGIVCCVENLTKNLILSDKTIRIKHSKKLLFSKFIALALNSPLIKPFIEQKMTGMADSQVNISQDNMKGFPIPLPPLLEQKRIVQKLDELMQYCHSLEASIKQSQGQNEKLLQQVLREALRKEPVGEEV
ncbi:MAG: restriction endonuclease subunit S [Bacteroidetes bacterium]|nr:restriction endonuclease subunit S [Bacteroidota bacterium]